MQPEPKAFQRDPVPLNPLPTETLGWGRAVMLVLWFAAAFGLVFFARDLQFIVLGWPFSFWLAAQGIVLLFVSIVAAYAWFANRADVRAEVARQSDQEAVP